jgi:Tfp pilus assembly protein PilF
LLLRVKAVDPEHPAILNEAALHELRSGNAVAARELLERAVEPRHLFALLQKATLLESQGKVRAAAKVYHNALQTLRTDRLLLDTRLKVAHSRAHRHAPFVEQH